MVLYYVITTYHLLNAIVHAANSGTEAAIICSEWIMEKFHNLQDIRKWFKEVYIMDANYRFFHGEEESKQYVLDQLKNLDRFSEIYVWGAQFHFGLLLPYIQKKYIFCEEAAGLLSRPDILRSIDRRAPLKSQYYDLLEEAGAYDGSSPYAEQKLCNVAAQTKDFCADETVINFDVVTELQRLSPGDRNEIISFFMNQKTIPTPEQHALLLTEHLANLHICTFEEQALLYQLFVDYLLSGLPLVIKPHPDDIMYYRRLFPNANVIRERFPSEFLPFIMEHRAQCVATVTSTSIYNLRNHYRKTIELNREFVSRPETIHRYYVALRIAESLDAKLSHCGVNEALLSSLTEAAESATRTLERTRELVLIDNITEKGEEGRTGVIRILNRLPETAAALLLNTQNDYCWYDYGHKELWDNMVPFVIRKKRLNTASEDFYAAMEDEVIYFFSKNKELIQMVKKIDVQKDLPNTGIGIEIARLTPEQEKIKMLEGILAATEKCLLYYIEKERKSK